MPARRNSKNRVRSPDGTAARSLSHAILSATLITCASVTSVAAQSVPIFFDTEPALITQIQGMANESANVPATSSSPWLTVATRRVSNDGFEMALERSESGDGTVSRREEVGFLAMESGTASSFRKQNSVVVQFATQRTSNTVLGWNNGCRETEFATTYTRPPIVFASKISRNDDNGGWLRRCSLSANAVGLVVDEDIAQDRERNHAGESAAIISFSDTFTNVFNEGRSDRWQLSTDRVTLVDTLRDTPRFTDVRFASEFQEMPIVFALATNQGSDPSALRIRNVTRNGFSIAQVEPTGNDGPHIAMTIHYLAITPGSHRFPDGTRIVADRVTLSNTQAAPGIGGDIWWKPTPFVEDDGGSNQAPEARFVTDSTSGPAPLTVQFDATTSSDDAGIVEYAWQFGDGSSATRPDAIQVSHQYRSAGSFNATLRVFRRW